MFHQLSKTPLFKGIPKDEIPLMLGQENYSIKRYNKDDMIASSGDECNHLMILIRGSVRGEMLGNSGQILKVEDVDAPRAIASGFIFGSNNIFPVSILANEASQILFIPKFAVLGHLRTNKVFLNNFLDSISDFIFFLSQRLYFLSFKTIREKLAQYLLNISSHDKNHFKMPKSHSTLSEYFGVTRPSLSRVFGELEKEGIIKTRIKEIWILDRKKLEKIIQ
jgi:CRP-like cAMP-binding protein